MSTQEALSLTAEEAVAFGQRLAEFRQTLDPKEQAALDAIVEFVGRKLSPEDVLPYSAGSQGIPDLVPGFNMPGADFAGSYGYGQNWADLHSK